MKFHKDNYLVILEYSLVLLEFYCLFHFMLEIWPQDNIEKRLFRVASYYYCWALI